MVVKDNGRPVLALQNQTVEVPAGEDVLPETAKDRADPVL